MSADAVDERRPVAGNHSEEVGMKTRWLACLAACVAVMPYPGSAASAYPERMVTLVVGAAPGSSGDMLARLVAQRLTEKWKQSVVVENRTGASGLLAANQVLGAPANGYTLYMSNDSTAINPTMMKTPPPDPRVVFAPISLLALIDFKLVVNAATPVQTVPELIAYLKAAPGKYSYASSGPKTPHHLMAELFKHQAQVDVLHVPYRGTAPAITAVLSNSSLYAFSGFPAVDGQIKAGQLRALATTGDKRNAGTPDLPTVGETLKGFSAASWWAMFVRAEVPADIQARLAADVGSIIADPQVSQRMRDSGLEPVGGDPAHLKRFLDAEIGKWARLPEGLIDKD